MSTYRVIRLRFAAVLALAGVLWLCPPALAGEVLLLHSGAGPTHWNQRLASGLIEGLVNEASVRQVYLSAHGMDEDDFDETYRELAKTLAGHPPEAVVAQGDVAFAFARKYGDLFPDAPLVFCAMARPDPRKLSECGKCTGIAMAYAVGRSVDLIFAMRPQTSLVVAVVDGTPGSARLMDAVNRAMRPYLDRAQILFPGFETGDDGGLTLDALGATLASVPSSGAVLFLKFSEDRDGDPVSDSDLAALFRERAASPVYLVSDELFGSGAVGGLMISAKGVGTDAAKVILRVLKGERASEMLPAPTRPELRFDGTALARFGLKAPEGAEVVNPPAGRVEEAPILPVTGLAWGIGLAALVALFMLLRNRYRP